MLRQTFRPLEIFNGAISLAQCGLDVLSMPEPAQKITSSAKSSDLSDNETGKMVRQAKSVGLSFGARLKSLLDERKDSDPGLKSRIAREIGVSKQVVSDWEKGVTPSADRLFRLADALGVDPRWLISGEGRRERGDDHDSWVSLPRLDLFAFGHPGKPEPAEIVPLRREWLSMAVRAFTNLWLAEMPSDAMPDVAREGEIIICRDPDVPLADGRVYILELEGRPIVRRVHVRPEGLVLKASDPSVDPITIPPDRTDSLVPIGRVLASISLNTV